jgi:hypothetical protein
MLCGLHGYNAHSQLNSPDPKSGLGVEWVNWGSGFWNCRSYKD